jgi:hypothetical protein
MPFPFPFFALHFLFLRKRTESFPFIFNPIPLWSCNLRTDERAPAGPTTKAHVAHCGLLELRFPSFRSFSWSSFSRGPELLPYKNESRLRSFNKFKNIKGPELELNFQYNVQDRLVGFCTDMICASNRNMMELPTWAALKKSMPRTKVWNCKDS